MIGVNCDTCAVSVSAYLFKLLYVEIVKIRTNIIITSGPSCSKHR